MEITTKNNVDFVIERKYPYLAAWKNKKNLVYLFIAEGKAICVASDYKNEVLLDGVEDIDDEDGYIPLTGSITILLTQ